MICSISYVNLPEPLSVLKYTDPLITLSFSITHSYEILGYKGKKILLYTYKIENYTLHLLIELIYKIFFNFFFLSYQLPFFKYLQLFFSLSHPLSYLKLYIIDGKNLIVNIDLNALVIPSGMSVHFISPISNE